MTTGASSDRTTAPRSRPTAAEPLPPAPASPPAPVDLPGLDPGRVSAWLSANVPGAVGPFTFDPIAGGGSNLTFRAVGADGRRLVVRRPPTGTLLATAHDVTREFRVMSALASTEVPVPRALALCQDEGVTGAPFTAVEFVDGVVYDDVDAVSGITPAAARAASFELVDVLARLHAVDPDTVGLGGFGRPQGFLPRQLRRWRSQWEGSALEDVPVVDEVAHHLEARLPPEGRSAIVHGDYSFNNTMFDRTDRGRMVALLDWELSTVGDPLTDLGTLLVYWGEVGAMVWSGRPRPQAHRAGPGFATTDELVERYAAASGADLTHLDFYQAFAIYKLAVIVQGSAKRTVAHDPERAARSVALVRVLADAALERCVPGQGPEGDA